MIRHPGERTFLRQAVTLFEIPFVLLIIGLLVFAFYWGLTKLYGVSTTAFYIVTGLLVVYFLTLVRRDCRDRKMKIEYLATLDPLSFGQTRPCPGNSPSEACERIKLDHAPPVLATELAELRPIDPVRDADDYYKTDPSGGGNWGSLLTDHNYMSVDNVRRDLQRIVDEPDTPSWAIVDRKRNRMIGWFAVRIYEQNHRRIAQMAHRMEMMYFVNLADWATKESDVCRDAASLLIQYLHDELQIAEIRCECWRDHRYSQYWLEFRGFKQTAQIEKFDDEHRKQRKAIEYRLTLNADTGFSPPQPAGESALDS